MQSQKILSTHESGNWTHWNKILEPSEIQLTKKKLWLHLGIFLMLLTFHKSNHMCHPIQFLSMQQSNQTKFYYESLKRKKVTNKIKSILNSREQEQNLHYLRLKTYWISNNWTTRLAMRKAIVLTNECSIGTSWYGNPSEDSFRF